MAENLDKALAALDKAQDDIALARDRLNRGVEYITNVRRAIIADPLPKDGDRKATAEEHNRMFWEAGLCHCCGLKLDPDPDANERHAKAEASAARLRKAMEDMRAHITKVVDGIANRDDMAYSNRDYLDLRAAVREGFSILTIALQPEPGTDPQPARGEDSPVSAHEFIPPYDDGDFDLVGVKTATRSPSPDLIKVREALKRIRTLTAKPSNVDRIEREAWDALARIEALLKDESRGTEDG